MSSPGAARPHLLLLRRSPATFIKSAGARYVMAHVVRDSFLETALRSCGACCRRSPNELHLPSEPYPSVFLGTSAQRSMAACSRFIQARPSARTKSSRSGSAWGIPARAPPPAAAAALPPLSLGRVMLSSADFMSRSQRAKITHVGRAFADIASTWVNSQQHKQEAAMPSGRGE